MGKINDCRKIHASGSNHVHTILIDSDYAVWLWPVLTSPVLWGCVMLPEIIFDFVLNRTDEQIFILITALISLLICYDCSVFLVGGDTY